MPICSSPAYPFDSHQCIFAAKSWVSLFILVFKNDILKKKKKVFFDMIGIF